MEALDQNWDNKPTSDDNQMAMWAHLIGILSCMSSFLGIIGTLVFYLVNRDKNPFVRQHAAQSLNFQITYFIANLLVGLLMVGSLFGSFFKATANNSTFEGNDGIGAATGASLFAGIGIVLIINVILLIVNLIICIKGAVSANSGETWKNPIALNLVK